jgi:hypothetical protein
LALGLFLTLLLDNKYGDHAILLLVAATLLAPHGYVVADPDHYHANTYDATIAYLTKI